MFSSSQLLKQYSIRVSKRAKYMRLTVSLEKGVVVVVPTSMSQRAMVKLASEFVSSKQLWLTETINKLQQRKQSSPTIEMCQLPETITLKAIEQVFFVNYQSVTTDEGHSNADGSSPAAKASITLQQTNTYELEISGDLSDKKKVFALLEAFFKSYARHYLEQRLTQFSQEFNLPYNRLTVRAQKTRWGSCSSKKNINLNYRLLFIDKELLDYILLHELVHTIHMNHSRLFWEYLESIMEDACNRDKQVNQITKELPCWIFH